MSFISKGVFQERIVKNGKLVEDVNANSFATNASGKFNYFVEGKKNNKKFTFTNMRAKGRGTKKRGTKKRGTKERGAKERGAKERGTKERGAKERGAKKKKSSRKSKKRYSSKK
jgi:hypothetical protein